MKKKYAFTEAHKLQPVIQKLIKVHLWLKSGQCLHISGSKILFPSKVCFKLKQRKGIHCDFEFLQMIKAVSCASIKNFFISFGLPV